jgi:hypothetical protein
VTPESLEQLLSTEGNLVSWEIVGNIQKLFLGTTGINWRVAAGGQGCFKDMPYAEQPPPQSKTCGASSARPCCRSCTDYLLRSLRNRHSPSPSNSNVPSCFFHKFFKDVFIIQGGFIVTILVRLTLYISYTTPIISPPQSLPTPLKAIARGFLVIFHVSI